MIKGEIEFQDRGIGILTVRIPLDHLAQRLQRLKGQPLIAPDLVDLIVIAERQKILRIGRILVGRVEIDEALCSGTALLVILVPVIGKGLHDHRSLGEVGIG